MLVGGALRVIERRPGRKLILDHPHGLFRRFALQHGDACHSHRESQFCLVLRTVAQVAPPGCRMT